MKLLDFPTFERWLRSQLSDGALTNFALSKREDEDNWISAYITYIIWPSQRRTSRYTICEFYELYSCIIIFNLYNSLIASNAVFYFFYKFWNFCIKSRQALDLKIRQPCSFIDSSPRLNEGWRRRRNNQIPRSDRREYWLNGMGEGCHQDSPKFNVQ